MFFYVVDYNLKYANHQKRLAYFFSMVLPALVYNSPARHRLGYVSFINKLPCPIYPI